MHEKKCQSNSTGTAGIEIVELHDSNFNDDTNFIEHYRHDIKSRSVLSKKGKAKGENHDSDDYVEPKGKGKKATAPRTHIVDDKASSTRNLKVDLPDSQIQPTPDTVTLDSSQRLLTPSKPDIGTRARLDVLLVLMHSTTGDKIGKRQIDARISTGQLQLWLLLHLVTNKFNWSFAFSTGELLYGDSRTVSQCQKHCM